MSPGGAKWRSILSDLWFVRSAALPRRLAIVGVWLAGIVGLALLAPRGETATGLPAPGRLVLSIGMERADLGIWSSSRRTDGSTAGGGVYNSGSATAVPSRDVAHRGSWSAKLALAFPSERTPGSRLFRWAEPHARREAYYSAWFFLPQTYRSSGPPNSRFWNIFQFKSSTADGKRNDPLWFLNIKNDGAGAMVLHLVWWDKELPGPAAGQVGSREFVPRVSRPLPVGRWFRLQAFLRQSKDFDGRLTVWQDGVRIFDLDGIRTCYDNPTYNAWRCDNAWSVNNYSDGLTPNPAVLYVDDAQIRATRRR